MSEEIENDPIVITIHDVTEANQLSLNCPICAGVVERYVSSAELSPVGCADCDTLYHKVCWQNNGGKCAVLGCDCTKCQPYGQSNDASVRVNMSDVPSDAQVSSHTKQLKQAQRERGHVTPQPVDQTFWGSLVTNILKAFGWRE